MTETSRKATASPALETPDTPPQQQLDKEKQPRRAVLSSQTVLDVILKLHKHATHDVPLGDLSSLTSGDLRLVLTNCTDGSPRVKPFLDLDKSISYATYKFHNNWCQRLDPVLVPTALTPDFAQYDDIRPGLCWGALFHRSCIKFIGYKAHALF
ncbi:hypothetical protein IMZ48_24515 [Candidatus Bathyarchaeota archaeon]|nr:hypothetical protein [Candidatus Bathyarchaeota archaeon]